MQDLKPIIEGIWEKRPEFQIKTYRSCITHGDLNRNNILLDKDGNVWLIDFYRTRQSYALRDFIRLETTIKFELLKEKNIDMLTEFEKELSVCNNFDSPVKFSKMNCPKWSDGLKKAFYLIKVIRNCANKKADINDVKEYNAALLLQTLKFLTWENTWSQYNVDHILESIKILSNKL